MEMGCQRGSLWCKGMEELFFRFLTSKDQPFIILEVICQRCKSHSENGLDPQAALQLQPSGNPSLFVITRYKCGYHDHGQSEFGIRGNNRWRTRNVSGRCSQTRSSSHRVAPVLAVK